MPADQPSTPCDGRTAAGRPEAEDRIRELEREVRTLQEAVRTRTSIGTAIGLLAERYGCSTQQAWALIGRVSSHTNIKARDVARVVVASADGSPEAGDQMLLETLAAHLPGLARPGRGSGGSSSVSATDRAGAEEGSRA